MKQKIKGVNGERELVHLFWQNNWTAWRIAGSGSIKYPSPDIVAGKGLRKIIIECKTTNSEIQYFSQKEIDDLFFLSEKIHVEPWLAIKFSRQDWLFIQPNYLNINSKSLCISKKEIEIKGKTFQQLLI
ncbi:hypothetical protein HYV79_02535 [Candidatus Woesearchaeota archaeon]|nr:hypothetical protein [Candidatus Woesearchaeota archaeon]